MATKAELQERIAELTKERDLLRTVIDEVTDLIYVKDAEGRFVLNNAAHMHQLKAATQDEVIGKTDFDYLPGEQTAQWYAVEREVIQTGQAMINREELVLDPTMDGKSWYSSTRVPWRDSQGKIIGLIGMGREITERKLAEETLRRLNHNLATLYRLGQEFTATLDLQQVTERLVREVTEIVSAEGALVWLQDKEQEGWLVCQAAFYGGQSRSLPDLRLQPGQGIAGWVAHVGDSAFVTDAPDDPRFFPGIDGQTGLRTTSLLSVPLRARDRVIGVLEVVNKLDADFELDELALVETLVAPAAIAIENAQLYEQAQREIIERQRMEEERSRLQQEVIKAQKQALQDLSTPIIPVMERIIVMPLIGSIDTLRAKDITRSLLVGIRQHRAKVVILDVTGVPIVDSGVASHLNKTVQAARLKGAHTIVTGISDAAAEIIVDLGIDWSGIETLADLQTGLRTALNRLGLKLTRG